MKRNNSSKNNEKMIHIRLQEEIHKRLRIHVAELDMTMQSWIVKMVERELNKVKGLNK